MSLMFKNSVDYPEVGYVENLGIASLQFTVWNADRNMNERRGIVLFRLGIWTLRGMGRGAKEGRCLLCKEEES